MPTMGKSWENHGKIMGKSWEHHVKRLGNIRSLGHFKRVSNGRLACRMGQNPVGRGVCGVRSVQVFEGRKLSVCLGIGH